MSDKGKKKTETRIMKVTMDADEFAKFDKGETHSNKGVRNKYGRISTLPDISSLSTEELPKKTVIRNEKVYLKPKEPTFRQMIKREIQQAVVNEVRDVISDPRKLALIIERLKYYWKEYIKPTLAPEENGDFKFRTRAEEILSQRDMESQQVQNDIIYQVEVLNENNERIIVTGEQAELLVNAMRKKARELAAMISLLFNIEVNDEKNDSDYVIEAGILKKLSSEESINTMKTLLAHRNLLDEGTVMCFEDWLQGFVRHENLRIPIPIMSERFYVS